MTYTGLVIKAHSGFFTVHTDSGERYTCTAAGRLTKGKHEEDALALGDHVTFELIKSEGFANGRITEVEPRVRSLARKDPIASIKNRNIRQVIVANVDVVVFVFACTAPDFHPRMLDRYLVGAEAQKLPILIVANKVDLVGIDAARKLFATYEHLDYEVLYTSSNSEDVAAHAGVDALRQRLLGKLSVLTGKSGVGKSSLLNALKPGLQLEVGRISALWKKGKHTTVVPELVALDENGQGSWIADTPGIRSYAIWDVDGEELDAYYREIKPYVGKCTFNDCDHLDNTPGCAVRAAVAAGKITEARYDSYCRLREELGKQPKW